MVASPLPVRLLFSGICLIVAALSLPLILGRVRPNPVYGFRTPRTLSSPEIWYPANAYAGRALFIASVISGICYWLAPDRMLVRTGAVLALLLVPMTVAMIASLLYLRRLRD